MNKRTKQIIIIAAILAITGVGVGIYLSAREQVEPPVASEEEEETMYTSMEDGEVITQSDIEGRRSIEDFARQAALSYFEEALPGSTSMTVRTVEWYFTDDNDSDNILVTVVIVDETQTLQEHMRVIEVIVGTNGDYEVKSTYEPDERYSI